MYSISISLVNKTCDSGKFSSYLVYTTLCSSIGTYSLIDLIFNGMFFRFGVNFCSGSWPCTQKEHLLYTYVINRSKLPDIHLYIMTQVWQVMYRWSLNLDELFLTMPG